MLRAFHSRQKWLRFRIDYRSALVRAREFSHRIHRIESQQRNEFSFIVILVDEQLGPAITSNLSSRNGR